MRQTLVSTDEENPTRLFVVAGAGEIRIPRSSGKSAAIAVRRHWRMHCTEDRMELSPLIQRVRSEFTEMPGLRLTPAQAGRLLGLDAQSCQRVLNALVQCAFLRWTPDGTVVRVES